MIQMMQGHALTILSGMPQDALFDAVITDPPYASGAATQNGQNINEVYQQQKLPLSRL